MLQRVHLIGALLFAAAVTNVSAWAATPSSSSSSPSTFWKNIKDDEMRKQIWQRSLLKEKYSKARAIRIEQGAAAARPFYQELLRDRAAFDITTASHLAASSEAHQRLGRVGMMRSLKDAEKLPLHLRKILLRHSYQSDAIAQLLHIPPERCQTACPAVYITPAAAGTQRSHMYPWWNVVDFNKTIALPSGLECLVSLFLLGLTLPLRILEHALLPDELQTMFDLNLLTVSSQGEKSRMPKNIASTTLNRSCDLDTNHAIVFSLVQIFPLSLTRSKTMFLATDWHPRVLSLTAIDSDVEAANTNELDSGGGADAVMYIGPDSLALVQHWLLNDFPGQSEVSIDDSAGATSSEVSSCTTNHSNQKGINLDLCTGSGIQALTSLCLGQAKHGICVDINPRALRFTTLNAALNQIKRDDITLILGNLVTGLGRPWRPPHEIPMTAWERQERLLVDIINAIISSIAQENSHSLSQLPLLSITANPPFLPVPPAAMVQKRHGLFSAGGTTGELVLAAIVALSSQLFSQMSSSAGSSLAVVSEFFLTHPSKVAAKETLLKDNGNSQNTSSSDEKFERNREKGGDKVKSGDANAFLRRVESWWGQKKNDDDAIDPVVLLYSGDNPDKNICCNPPQSEIDIRNANTATSSLQSTSPKSAKGLLFTNEFPLDAATYAFRRADSTLEHSIWLQHLEDHSIDFVSPGLLYLMVSSRENGTAIDRQSLASRLENCSSNIFPRTNTDDLVARKIFTTRKSYCIEWNHIRVPRSPKGSIWTPSNAEAVAFTRSQVQRWMFGTCSVIQDETFTN